MFCVLWSFTQIILMQLPNYDMQITKVFGKGFLKFNFHPLPFTVLIDRTTPQPKVSFQP